MTLSPIPGLMDWVSAGANNMGDNIPATLNSFFVACHGGQIEVLKAKGTAGKVPGAELAKELNLAVGQFFTL